MNCFAALAETYLDPREDRLRIYQPRNRAKSERKEKFHRLATWTSCNRR